MPTKITKVEIVKMPPVEIKGMEILSKKLDKIINLLSPNVAKDKNDSIAKEAIVNERFVECTDGTIKDLKTGLMWQREGSKERMNWDDANKYCKSSEVGSYKDWRLPTKEELESILDLNKKDPAINPIFKCESAGYWSSTTYADYTDFAWFVYFFDGFVYIGNKGNYYFVRPVRQY